MRLAIRLTSAIMGSVLLLSILPFYSASAETSVHSFFFVGKIDLTDATYGYGNFDTSTGLAYGKGYFLTGDLGTYSVNGVVFKFTAASGYSKGLPATVQLQGVVIRTTLAGVYLNDPVSVMLTQNDALGNGIIFVDLPGSVYDKTFTGKVAIY